MNENKNIQKFMNKKSLLDHRLNNDVLENGIAYIPCHAESMEDIISKYSIRDCETLNSEHRRTPYTFLKRV